MLQNAPTLGMLLLAALSVAAVGLARWRGMALPRIFLYVTGVLVGEVLGALPGGFYFIAAAIRASTGGGAITGWTGILLMAGSAAGGLVGLRAVRRRSHACPPVAAWLIAVAGFAAGGGVSYLALLMVQDSQWGKWGWLILGPVFIATATIAGYSLGFRTRS